MSERMRVPRPAARMTTAKFGMLLISRSNGTPPIAAPASRVSPGPAGVFGATGRAAAGRPDPQRARRSSRCTTARPGALRRPCGSSRVAAARDRSVRANARRPPPLRIRQHRARGHEPALDQKAEGNARRRPLVGRDLHRALVERKAGVDPLAGHFDVGRLALDPDPAPPEPPGNGAGRARPEERVEHYVARLRAGGAESDKAGLPASASDAPCARLRP